MQLLLKPLIEHVRAQFAIDWTDIHGISHWARVRSIGQRLALETGADPAVVELFAWLHDSRRFNDGTDPEHGRRAADLASALQGKFFELTDNQLGLLREACIGHSDGHTRADPTVMTCWDSDRLDLGRIGIRPDPAYLCTAVARDPSVIKWAWLRSQRWASFRRKP
ncbi:MAG: hypothetical protein ACI841_000886 [Planctomycetota bacterium]|jgi:uncharacterized protein